MLLLLLSSSSSSSLLLQSLFLTVVALVTTVAFAQSSSSPCSAAQQQTPSYPAPSVAPGYEARLVATDLEQPRGLVFDSRGHLLVLEQGVGIRNLELADRGGTCIDVVRSTVVIASSALDHGLALSSDGRTLYASSSEAVFSWTYDPDNIELRGGSDNNRTVVSNMGGSGHVTRTLLLSQKRNGTLLVSRGSTSNVDLLAEEIESGHCQIKAFDLDAAPRTGRTGYDFNTDGKLLGWGLRNSVGVAEHPVTGGIYSVENSVDEIMRDEEDIHEDNPGEELNFHGTLDDDGERGNYGYPNCFAAWAVDDIPNKGNLTVGSQFVMETDDRMNDEFCARERIPPTLTFQAHTAPLDIKFTPDGNEAWITFHGSWDRTRPAGYKLSKVQFSDGSPVAASDSTTAAQDILTNPDNDRCPSDCFRPVGLALDSKGRIFMSSDSTGEVYVIMKVDASTTSDTEPSSKTTSPSSAGGLRPPCSLCAFWIAFGLVCLLV
ncbi:MAG: hypothetical protein M1837_005723 [Sclerophora amabilis]|nr:MAG: hypothetical protein M1837_005723 [Sclerophora amabilis]